MIGYSSRNLVNLRSTFVLYKEKYAYKSIPSTSQLSPLSN